jgi:hypothetical protein
MNDYLPFEVILSNPINTACKAGLLVLLGLILGLMVPGLLYYEIGVFSHDDVVKHLSDNLKDVKKKITTFDDETEKLKNDIVILNSRIVQETSASNQSGTVELLKFRRDLAAYIDSRKPPFQVVGFYPDRTMFLWSILYISFFWLIYIFAPQVKFEKRQISYGLLFLGLLILYRWPTWLRNTGILGNTDRFIYNQTNFDVSPAGFFVQEGNAVIVVWCMLELFLIWLSYLTLWRKEVAAFRRSKILTTDQMYSLVQALSRQFAHWQLCSVLLALAFVPYTFFFWTFVVDFGDHRYIPAALITHALWGACWVAVSLPLAQTWYEWTLKQAMSSYQVNGFGESDEKIAAEKFHESPIGFLNVATSLAVASLTFGSPIIKAL